MIINNKQINIWRGQDFPPTLYHIWLYSESELRIFNGTEWVTIIDSINISDRLSELSNQLNDLTNLFNSAKINNKLIKDNPVLNSDDINNTYNGVFINSDSVTENLKTIDNLLVTQILD